MIDLLNVNTDVEGAVLQNETTAWAKFSILAYLHFIVYDTCLKSGALWECEAQAPTCYFKSKVPNRFAIICSSDIYEEG